MYLASLIVVFALAAIVLSAALFLIVEIYAVFIGHFRGAPYVRSKKEKIEAMLELAKIQPGEAVADLGSGDGAILIEAAKQGARAVGVEINPFLAWYSQRHISRAGLKDKIKIIKSDFKKYHLGSTDVVFVYLVPGSMEELGQKFSRELKPGARVVSNGFPLPSASPHASKSGVYIYYY